VLLPALRARAARWHLLCRASQRRRDRRPQRQTNSSREEFRALAAVAYSFWNESSTAADVQWKVIPKVTSTTFCFQVPGDLSLANFLPYQKFAPAVTEAFVHTRKS
jgi:hypothetical protein